MLLDIDGPGPIGAKVSGHSFENPPAVHERCLHIQRNSWTINHIFESSVVSTWEIALRGHESGNKSSQRGVTKMTGNGKPNPRNGGRGRCLVFWKSRRFAY